MEEQRNRFLKAGIVLLALSFLLQSYRMVVANNANNHLASVKTRVAIYQAKIESTESRLDAARKKHLKIYLASYSLDEPKKKLSAANEQLKQTDKTSHPLKRIALADKAMQSVQGLSLANINQELDFLDKALKNWKTEPSVLQGKLSESTAFIGSLEKQGYFPTHFLDSRKLIAAGKGRYILAIKLSKLKFEGNSPDYRRIYANCITGERYCSDAYQLAKAIPDTRGKNDARIREMPDKIADTRSLFESAWYAARRLQPYPNYQCRTEVRSAFDNLVQAEVLLSQAKKANSFEEQDFVVAAKKLSSGEEIVDTSKQQLQSAIDTWNNLQSAIGAIPAARTAASQRINEAQDHINSYSRNSQTDAEEYLTEARSYNSRGSGLENSDPIQSLTAFQNAKSKADAAYDAVDTADHSSSSYTSSDDDSGSSYSGGGSSNYGGGSDYGGGSNYGGGSYDSSPGGSYDSSPSGSYGDGL